MASIMTFVLGLSSVLKLVDDQLVNGWGYHLPECRVCMAFGKVHVVAVGELVAVTVNQKVKQSYSLVNVHR